MPLRLVTNAAAQDLVPPAVTLVPAPALSLTGGVDSNSPAVWGLVDGVETLQVVTSIAGQPSLAAGRRLTRMGPATPVAFITHPGDGVWMESVIVDEGGTWYGYYHNEVPAALCGRLDRVHAAHRCGALARQRRHLGRPRDHPRSAAGMARLRHHQPGTSSAASAT